MEEGEHNLEEAVDLLGGVLSRNHLIFASFWGYAMEFTAMMRLEHIRTMLMNITIQYSFRFWQQAGPLRVVFLG